MTGSTWPAGQVAMVTFGFTNGDTEPVLARLDERGVWRSVRGHQVWQDANVVDIRPLVVIDPEDGVQAERLARLLFEALCKVGGDWESGVEYELRAHMRDALQEFAKPEPARAVVAEERPIVHAVMYRNYKIGSLCNSGAWGPATLFSMVTDAVTCPGCRTKLDGVPPMGATS